ncbi:MAG: HlyD family efflux transporter periplasmic adaptor subunit [Gemmatales bacterium]|nr:HlyD family efflux transporter periplasmic adaptor subunit [Gemmatales bacterium]MDW8385568.1 HlyD family efflux transporter periplasmic adaptor subunit [Gemmatales bacterium]
MKKLLAVLILIAAGVAGGVYFYEHKSHKAPALPKTERVDRGEVVESVSATVRVHPVGTVYVGCEMPYARISEIPAGADIGKRVAKGDTLVKFDDVLARARLAEAEAAVLTAEAAKLQAEAKLQSAQAFLGQAKAKREVALKEQKMILENRELTSQGLRDKAAQVVTEAEEGVNYAEAQIREAEAAIKAAESNILKAKAGVTAAEENLKMHVVTAPIDGIIIDRKITSVGQVVSPQTHPVLFILVPDLNTFELEAQVGEADIAKIKVGMEATFKLDAYADEDTAFQAVVREIAYVPTPPATGRWIETSTSGPGPVTYRVTLDVKPSAHSENRPLKPGMTGNVDFVLRRVPDAIRIPNAALAYRPLKLSEEEAKAIEARETSGWKPIWVMTDGQSKLLFIKTGANDGNRTEVTQVDGGTLDAGMEVVTENPPQPISGGLFGIKDQIKIL